MLTISNEKILKDIENIARNPDSNYLEAVVSYAETNDIEIESLGELIRKVPSFRSRIQDEAETLNMLEKTSKLPV